VDVVEATNASQLRVQEAQRDGGHGHVDKFRVHLAGLITTCRWWWWRRRRYKGQVLDGRFLLRPDRRADSNRDRLDRILAGVDPSQRLHFFHRHQRAGQYGLGAAGPCRGTLLAADDQLYVPRRRQTSDDELAVGLGWGLRRAAAVFTAGKPLLERAVPVVLDGKVRSPWQPGGDDGPAGKT
jgi:hypothetical protein